MSFALVVGKANKVLQGFDNERERERERERNTKQEQNPKNRKEHRWGEHARKWKAGKMERSEI